MSPPSPSSELEKVLRQACALLHRGARDGARAEDLLRQFPALADHADLAVELIYTEFTAREQLGQSPRPEEFAERFPRWQAQLQQQFEVHRFLADDPGAAAAALPAHGQFGDYVLLEEIAQTDINVLYQARHRLLDRVVALKVSRERYDPDAPAYQHYLREAKVGASLGQPPHPFVVQLYEAAVADERAFLAQEFVRGGNLAARLRNEPQPPRPCAAFAEKLAQAVAFVHQRGIVHRDLKPANILLQTATEATPDHWLLTAVPKVADFGLARFLQEEEGSAAVLAGTPSYMAPEQARAEANVGPPVDVYALGAIVYEMLTGRPPFLADTPLNTLTQVIHEDPAPPRRLQAGIPADLETICLKCLAKEPRRRYERAGDLADDLRRFLAGEPIRARPAGAIERAWKWCRRFPTRAALLAVLVLATATITAGTLWTNARLRVAADDLRAQLDATRQSLYTNQLAQVEEIYRTDPGRALLLLDDPERCPLPMRDFAWHMFHHLCRQDLHTLTGPGELTTLALAADGHMAAAGPAGVRAWDRCGKVVGDLDSPGPVGAISFGPNGVLLARPDGSVQRWDLPAVGQRDAGRFVSIGEDRKVRVVDARSGEVVATQAEESFRVQTAALSPDGERVALAGGNSVRLCDVASGQSLALAKLPGTGAIAHLAFAPQGDALAVIGPVRERLTICDPVTLEVRRWITGGRKSLRAAAFSPDGGLIATVGDDRDVKLWDAVTLTERAAFKGHTAIVRAVAFTPDGRTLATTGDDGSVRLWAVPAPPTESTDPGPARRLICFASQRHTPLVVGRDDGSIMEYDRRSAQLIPRHHQEEAVLCLAAHGDVLAAGGPSGQVRVWTPLAAEPPREFAGHTRPVRNVAFAPHGGTLASASEDGTVRLWDVKSGQCVATLKAGAGPVRAVGFSPDGRTLASGNDNGTVCLWDTTTQRELARWQAGRKALMFTTFSPDGRTLACGGLDYLVTLWDMPGRTKRAELPGHTEYVFSATFTPDSRTLATGSGNRFADVPGEVRLWDVATGHPRATLAGQTGPVLFHPDCDALVTVDGYRAVRIWPAGKR